MNKSKDKEIIEFLCTKYDITQSELAKRTGKTKQHISNIATGSRGISKELYDCLVKLFPNDLSNSNYILPDEITNKTFTKLREYYRLSKSALARQLNVKPSLISQIEQERRGVSKALKNKLRMLYSPDKFNMPENVHCTSQNVLLEELINRADTKVITIDKSTKYLVIKIDDSDIVK